MTAIVDYGVGNLFSLKASLSHIGAPCIVTGDADELSRADRIILPGVGAFGDAMQKLHESGLVPALIKDAAAGKPLLGICLGMQLLFTESLEYGQHNGLGLIDGRVVSLRTPKLGNRKVPHMGWNSLELVAESPLLSGIQNGDFVYFVHSYYAAECDDALCAVADYGVRVPAIVARKNVFGCQFHPEKSGQVGLNILKAFCAQKS